jgi:ABC-type glycerol-3-phosphate transport system substrate-binding protein
MYAISIKARQNYNRGFVSNRSLSIDGEIPFVEASAVSFSFNNKWKLFTVSGAEGEALYFPLKKGGHTIRLEVTHGALGGMLDTLEESVYRLNEIYRKVLVLTGPSPDAYRDYRIGVVYPEIIVAMEHESKVLYKLADDLTAYSGERGAPAAGALTIARQLELFADDPDKIARSLGNFKSNISSLGNSLLSLANSELDIDYLVIGAAGAKPPVIRDWFLTSIVHEIRSFFSSFFMNYNNIGDTYQDGDSVQLWIVSGRDQSTILKGMIDDTFTPASGIPVNMKLVDAATVMPAVVAGTGPDAVLTMDSGTPVNYALRGAVQDVSKLPGFDELSKQFDDSVFVPFRYNGGVYALPETQSYPVMFYRTDIFEELGISPPETWEDLINILPVIQKNNMNVGIPSMAGAVDMTGFIIQLYQRLGALYNDDGSRVNLDGQISIEAFDAYTKFFTQYKTPTEYNFSNRFRTGEMPLAFADYGNFNTLEVFAPEIRGLWNFGLVPGVKGADGRINHSVPTGTHAAMLFTSAHNPENAWDFLKWWVSEDTQVRFGRELESVMGAAARYATANLRAFKRLPWSTGQMKVLEEQRSWAEGIPHPPGSYYIGRHMANAVRRVINNSEDARETLLDYAITMNDELSRKRKEFGFEK